MKSLCHHKQFCFVQLLRKIWLRIRNEFTEIFCYSTVEKNLMDEYIFGSKIEHILCNN